MATIRVCSYTWSLSHVAGRHNTHAQVHVKLHHTWQAATIRVRGYTWSFCTRAFWGRRPLLLTTFKVDYVLQYYTVHWEILLGTTYETV